MTASSGDTRLSAEARESAAEAHHGAKGKKNLRGDIEGLRAVAVGTVLIYHVGIPFLPGIATSADIMRGLDLGLDRFKFFPAMAAGGLPALKALAAPFGQCRFCPTGGISLENAPEWLAFDPVLCVGGSWVSPKGAPDKAVVKRLAAEAFALR